MSAQALTPERVEFASCGSEIAYRVRRSMRARRIRLTVSARDGLVVTLPRGVAERHARDAVRARATWALDALGGVAERRALVLGGAAAQLPHAVDLLALDRSVRVSYSEPGGAAAAVAREREGRLVVTAGAGAGPTERLAAVRRWRDRTARTALPPLLGEAALGTGLEPVRVTVRGQRTRWGSCSSRGTVSLNRDLIFLPPHLVSYVMLHELCHLSHLDHSPRFWKQMSALCPDALKLRHELRTARDDYVPVWADV